MHVSRILTKLDATTRTEAAALAHAAGLVRGALGGRSHVEPPRVAQATADSSGATNWAL